MRPYEAAVTCARYFSVIHPDKRWRTLLPQVSPTVDTLLLPDALFASAVLTEAPQGVAALIRPPQQATLETLAERAEGGPLVVTAGIQDPGNLGTILRSAEAFGAGGILFGEGTVSEWNPKVVRASAGSLFRIPCGSGKAAQRVSWPFAAPNAV